MSEPFVLGRAGAARWVVHTPEDLHGDGYIFTVRTELHEDGMTAVTTATVGSGFDGRETTLAGFLDDLVADWHGWDGSRVWQSMERELTVDARHDRRRHVSLRVTLRPSGPSGDDSAWSATAVFVLEAGEEMSRLAGNLAAWSRL
ncbi:DUF6228 family protein [Actinoplanes flavus]|uniref:Uncharacterized protein n=1 Tax=Actinoplanes flavus TaxID=2820290 RepID=A0ABS3UVW6_9ACTN|nr:DUF6228 family protein [Actinoplanes flavus]MBO3742686.1 hypothetical protein [Actinoplanes flavus]